MNEEILQHKMQYWFNSPLGRLVLKIECDRLREFLEKSFGYYALQLGGLSQNDYLQASPIEHKIYFNRDIKGKFIELPFLLNSVDLVVVPHVLEFTKKPRKILNEIYHILIPDGSIVVIGFNPFSLWGVIHLFKRNNIPWQGKFNSISRMRHWLSQLGFKIIDCKTFFFRPPLHNGNILHKTLFMEKIGHTLWPNCSALYIILAKKSTLALTPIKLKRRLVKQRVTATSPYVKPTTKITNEKS